MNINSRFDILVSDLCDEIDQWKAEANYWRKKYEDQSAEYNKAQNDRLESAKKGVASMLMLALSVRDNPDGSLSIDKENRKLLSQTIK